MNNKNRFQAAVWPSLHETLKKYAKEKGLPERDYTQRQCNEAFNGLPQELQEEAMSWGFDTLVREKACDFWKTNGCLAIDHLEANNG